MANKGVVRVRSQATNVSAKDFVACWMKHVNSNGSVSEVAKELGIKDTSAYQRAAQLRKRLKEEQGVILPTLPMNSESQRGLDLSDLASLIQSSMTPKAQEEEKGDESEETSTAEDEGDDKEVTTGELMTLQTVNETEL